MDKGSILAHRGWWQKESEKNTPAALVRALSAGFGIETDIRDLNGELVISHDPPVDSQTTANWLFNQYNKIKANGRIALNIKSDGLQGMLERLIKSSGLEKRTFVFDMSVPDTILYIEEFLYIRISEYENPAIFETKTEGVLGRQLHGNVLTSRTMYFLP